MNISSLIGMAEHPGVESASLAIAENNSIDQTREILLRIESISENIRVVLLGDLDSLYPMREARLAFCRDSLLEIISNDIAHLADKGNSPHLYIPIDLDSEIACSISPVHFIRECQRVAEGSANGIFPASAPFYYDIYALRCEGWVETDCWANLRQLSKAGNLESYEEHLINDIVLKQKMLGELQQQQLIPVKSAFGGIGIYNFDVVKNIRYFGEELRDEICICEHTAFNRLIDNLFISTEFVVRAPMEHISNKNAFEHRMLFALTPAPQYCLDPSDLTRTYVLSGAAGELRIELPQLHPWPEYITQIPLYDRFFPFLCAKIGEGTIIDIGANIGDTVCMLRSFGASQRIIAVEPDIEFHELLQKNINRNSLQNVDTYQYAISSTPQRVKLSKDNRLSTANVELIKSTGKSQPDSETLETRTFTDIVNDFHLSAEEIKVIKIDTDGFDWDVLQSVSDWLVESPNNNLELPIIFYEHQTYLTSKGSSDNNRENQENLFLRALQNLRTHGYIYYVILDNFGTMIIKTSDLSELAELSKYPRRSELMNRRTTIHYYDVLACTDKSTAFVDKVTCEYLDNPSIPDGGQRDFGQPKIYLKAGE